MDPAPGQSFGDLLKQLRLRAGLTQEELAERAEMSPRGLIYLERGARQPRAGTIRRLIATLGLNGRDRATLFAAARGEPAGASPAAAPVPPVDLDGGLGAPLTSLIGRKREVESAVTLLRGPTVRLLTITGPGGVGKTRVAQQVAVELAPEYRHGVVAVALTPITSPTPVLATVAQRLGIRGERGSSSWEGLVAYLRDKHLLILLDNFEQVHGAGPDVARLLVACPYLRALITSRVALRLQGEHELPVPPLALPDLASSAELAAVGRVPSVALFVERAQAVRPSFTLTAAEAPAVVEVCHRLDGLPLAIELAAARSNILPPRALLARLEPRLPVLVAGREDRPSRQRTMADAIAWSYDLLAPEEQRAFRSLSVFVGGFDLGAGSWVMGDGCTDDRSPSAITHDLTPKILDLVSTLVDHSLVRQDVDTDGEPRFAMLETIREFGVEQLEAAGERPAARRRHAEYVLALAEAAEPWLLGPRQQRWLNRLDAELDNVRAALAWSQHHDGLAGLAPAEIGCRLVDALFWYWYIRCHLTEGIRWAETMLPRSNGVPARHRAGVLFVLGSLKAALGDHRGMVAHTEAGIALFRQLGDRRKVALGIGGLGLASLGLGDHERAAALFAESLALARALDDSWLIGWNLGNLGRTALTRGDLARALELLEDALDVQCRVGDPFALGLLLQVLTRTHRARGDWARATVTNEQYLPLAREVGFTRGVVGALAESGRLALRQRAHEQALSRFRESLALAWEVGERSAVATGLEGVAAALAGRAAGSASEAGRRDLTDAARMLGAAEVLRAEIGVQRPSVDLDDCAETVAQARAGLGDAAFEAYWHEGRMMSLDQEGLGNALTGYSEHRTCALEASRLGTGGTIPPNDPGWRTNGDAG